MILLFVAICIDFEYLIRKYSLAEAKEAYPKPISRPGNELIYKTAVIWSEVPFIREIQPDMELGLSILINCRKQLLWLFAAARNMPFSTSIEASLETVRLQIR
jgi:hypothetical protein